MYHQAAPSTPSRITSIPTWGSAPTPIAVIEHPVDTLRQQLDELPTNQLETALRFANEQLQAAGIRLYIPGNDTIYRLGNQPQRLDDGSDRPVEQHLLWQQFLKSGHMNQSGDADLSSEHTWVIHNVSYEFRLRSLARAFKPAAIEHVMIVPLWHEQQQIGSMSVFRDASQPRWSLEHVVLAQQFGQAFARSIYDHQLVKSVHSLNQTLTTRTEELQQVVNYQDTLAAVINKIRASIDLETIFSTTVEEIYRQLQADRVVVYRFKPDWSGEFLAEAVGARWVPLKIAQTQPEQSALTKPDRCLVQSFLDAPVNNLDHHLQSEQGGEYNQSRQVKQVNDIYNRNFPDCYMEVLEQYQCRAYLTAPIYLGEQLWGLLAIYQNSGPRQWRPSEVSLIQQISEQLGVAIQQAELLKMQQNQAAELAETLTELTRTQAQMLQTEKMSSLGQLTAGLSHEINNPVTFIHSNLSHLGQYFKDLIATVELYQKYHPQTHPIVQGYLDQIDLAFLQRDIPKVLSSMEHGTERISDVMLSLQNFSRLDEEGIKAIDLHEGIDSVILILQHQCRARDGQPAILVQKQYSRLPEVECDGSLMNQVFINLMSNAIDALRAHDQQRTDIAIATHPSQICITTAISELDGKPAVRVTIQDNGPGIPEHIQRRIFDPFFTTKEIGEGSGLGLSISHHIVVENHQGKLHCKSSSGNGTTFEIEIPVQAESVCRLPKSTPITANLG
ncbi:GAF domain-containing protein [filamentous cyanobacterium LEGE 11480]|uniref:histidine kinase n=1 Tax=Romeriopsis navalis LEGE 11480 TaxID=2777977 RepID=A0A928Z5M0_9CYAN|nr:GAF domain-containing protein [Romeriopsis navalis]MBE9031415.1 GAF domain-containing protein [Romeriopsis navalis LEGE 11480]